MGRSARSANAIIAARDAEDQMRRSVKRESMETRARRMAARAGRMANESGEDASPPLLLKRALGDAIGKARRKAARLGQAAGCAQEGKVSLCLSCLTL